MPQLFGIAFLGVALYGAYRMIKREMKRVGEELDQQAAPKQARSGAGAKTIPNLVQDPETGIYKPEERP